MKTLLATALTTLLAVTSVAVAGPQQAPSPTDRDDRADSSTPEAARKPDLDPLCVHATGSRILPRKDRRHCMGIGRTYTRDELMMTGGLDMADALRRLDPSVR